MNKNERFTHSDRINNYLEEKINTIIESLKASDELLGAQYDLNQKLVRRIEQIEGLLQTYFDMNNKKIKKMKYIKSRLDLLNEMKNAGIKLWGTPEDANLDNKNDPKVLYEPLTHDLDVIFDRQIKGEPPWNQTEDQQGQLANIQQTLQALLDYYKKNKRLPNQDKCWWLRTNTSYISGLSFVGGWDPDHGLYVDYADHGHTYKDGGTIPLEVGDLELEPSALSEPLKIISKYDIEVNEITINGIKYRRVG